MDFRCNPVEVGLKSPVTITIALGFFIRKLSIFDWMCSHKITFSCSLLAVCWPKFPFISFAQYCMVIIWERPWKQLLQNV